MEIGMVKRKEYGKFNKLEFEGEYLMVKEMEKG